MSVQAGIDMLSGGGNQDDGNNPTEEVSPVADDTTTPVTETTQQDDNQSTGHPAWDEVLKYVDPNSADLVRQKLKEWDSGVNRRFETVQSRYKPYEPFLNHQPQTLEQAITLLNVFNGDPRRLYDQMAEHFGFNRGQGQDDNLDVGEFADDEEQSVPDVSQHPMFQQLREQQLQIQQYLAAEQQRKEQEEGDAWLDGEMKRLEAENPGVPLDWDYIINKAAVIAEKTGNSETALTHAVTDFIGLTTKLRTPTTTAPRVLPTSGGIPVNNNEELKKALVDDSTRRKLGVEMLQRLTQET